MVQQPPNPTRAGSLAWDLGLAALVLVVAVVHRQLWTDLVISIDWNRTVGAAADIIGGEPDIGSPLFLYTSMPALLLAGVLKVAGEPLAAFRLWAVLASLGAPLLFLALRPLTGRVPALLAGLVLALSITDAHAAIGLRSPYVITSFGALACCGLAGCALRRAWGPGLLAGGAAMVTSLDLGLAPLGAVAVLVAFDSLLRLRGQEAAVAWVLALVFPGLVAAVVGILDVEELYSAAQALSSGFPPMPFMKPDPLWAAQAGLGASLPVLVVLALWALTAAVAAVIGALHPSLLPPAQGPPAGGFTAAVLLMAAAGAAPWVWAWHQHGYLWHHHLVGLQPVLLAAAAGCGAVLAARLPGRWLRVAAWSPLGLWLLAATSQVPAAVGQRLTLRTIPQRSLSFAAAVSTAASQHDRARPEIVLLSPQGGFDDRCVFTQLAQHLSRARPAGAPPSTSALAPPSLTAALGWGPPDHELPGSGLALWHYDSSPALLNATQGLCPDARQDPCWSCIYRGEP